MDLQSVGALFGIEGEYKGFEQIKTGNINQTYCVTYLRDGEDKKYIIQKVNTYVFKNPEGVMQNIERVTEHIRAKVKEKEETAKRKVLHFLHTPDGKNFARDEKGGFWRGYRYIDNSITYNLTDDLFVMVEAGKGFGAFQKHLSDFDASCLFESIPDFHNTKKRLERLFEVAEKDVCNRVKDVKVELDYLRTRYDLACSLCTMLENGELPLRVTHNDTKCNNVLLDIDTNQALAVIDLDTVMPGLTAYDFGDSIRFGANNAIEDDPEYSKVFLDLNKYEAFVSGFIPTIKDSLTQKELETMHLGAYVMTAELVARFMTDYLEGDVYFKTDYPEHNLVRTKNQYWLAFDMEKKLDQMQKIVLKYC
ncbi:MAG: aminoglycoside phosphotransferase family protein [Ruminococcaceae bacterium]|nr:aminoglycoside phosphotransferase family protein [Oscillospiraceae bacterium]